MRPAPLPLRVYCLAADLLLPVAARVADRTLAEAGVPPERRRERLGHPTLPRPPGALAWFHAASVGESLSVLDLVGAMLRARPDLSALVTTGTASSAAVLASRLPPRAVHQFAPLDAARPLRRFLRRWRPGLLVLAESELWPQTILRADAAGIPVALVGARLSERSLLRWERAPAVARALLSRLSVVRTQGEPLAARLRALGAPPGTRAGGDLKAAAPPPPDDPAARAALRAGFGARPLWAAVSTHDGEEEVALAAHAAVREAHPDAALILAPRHPERGDAVAALLGREGWAFARRGRGEAPGPDTAVLLADTLGETGLWFRMGEVVALGGGWGAAGGHNPWEPAALGRPVLSGPDVPNAAAAWEALVAAGGARLAGPGELGRAVAALLADPERARAMGEAAAAAREAAAEPPDALARDLLRLLPQPSGIRASAIPASQEQPAGIASSLKS